MKTNKKNIGKLIKTPNELLQCVNDKKWVVQTSYRTSLTIVAAALVNQPFIKVMKLINTRQLYHYIKNK